MPDSMNFANDPNAMPQQGMPMQGWDPTQYGAPVPDAYNQGMYPQDQQAMYGQQQMGAGQMYQGYPDQMQQGYDQQAQFGQQQAYYPEQQMAQPYMESPEAEAERMAQQAQLRAHSMFGPKNAGGMPVQDMEYGAVMGSGMPMAQPQQDFGMQQPSGMPQPQQQPTGSMAPIPEPTPMPAAQPQPQPQPQAHPQVAAAPTNMTPPPKGKATLSLILGIFSIILAIIPPIGILLGWLSTRFAKQYKNAGGTAAVGDSGRIFGRVGFVFSIVMFIVMGFALAYIAGATFGNYGARALAIYFNHSPIGSLFAPNPLFPLA